MRAVKPPFKQDYRRKLKELDVNRKSNTKLI